MSVQRRLAALNDHYAVCIDPAIAARGGRKLSAISRRVSRALMSAVGQNRKSTETAGMSAPGGRADVIRTKTDISPGMSGVGGKAEVNFGSFHVR
jgi:hypothetical protein